MNRQLSTTFGFALRRTSSGWSWTTFDVAGKPGATGVAGTRAAAAAHILRELTEAALSARRSAQAH